jgi:DNA-binding NtrC family response regulator
MIALHSEPMEEMIGQSDAMQNVFAVIRKLSDTDTNILILGENGTGKDLVARAIYRNSPRSGKQFVSIDLGSIPETLFEGELFGYEKGAFTDAKKEKPGRMEAASGGTLFLDEIANLSLPMQSKLLTAIEKKQITRLGSAKDIHIDIRFICATNADIYQDVENSRFRQDLLYRINTIELHIPPLRERGDDIILLAEHFVHRFAKKYKKYVKGISKDAQNKLLVYQWPGNVRELQHSVERAIILSDGNLLKTDNFILQTSQKRKEAELLNLKTLENQAIQKALVRAGGNMNKAAELLGITRFALYRKIKQ